MLYIANDAFGLYDGRGQVGNAAHLGGAAYGMAYWLLTRGMARGISKDGGSPHHSYPFEN